MILMVMSHADDELICGWPILFNENIDKHILLCSTDENNPQRQWCKHRKHTFIKVCQLLNIPYTILPLNSEFHKEVDRYNGKRIIGEIVAAIKSIQFDEVFTHNSWGEYGHEDHKLIFRTVCEHIPQHILTTDICFQEEQSWHKPSYIRPNGDCIEICKLDVNKYMKIENIYREDGVWTWSYEPIRNCRLYKE